MSGVTDNYGLILPATGEAYDVGIINANNIQIDTKLKNLDNSAKGQYYLLENTANSGPHVDGIVSNIGSFAFKGGRRYVIEWDASFILGDSTTFYYFSIGTCSTTDTAGDVNNITVLNGRTLHRVNTTGTYTGPIKAYFNPASDTTLQVKFRATRVGGAATATVLGNAGEKASYTITDMGHQI